MEDRSFPGNRHDSPAIRRLFMTTELVDALEEVMELSLAERNIIEIYARNHTYSNVLPEGDPATS